MQIETKALLDVFAPLAPQFFSQYARHPFKKVGSEFRGPCPNHNGEDNNCTIYENGDCHCFSRCGHFDVLDFLQEREGLSFMEAKQKVADYCGVPMETALVNSIAKPSELRPPEAENAVETPKLDPALADTMHTRLLKSPDSLKWLEMMRGITLETVKRFKIGIVVRREGETADVVRVSFPVFNEKNELTNVRLHRFAREADPTDGKQKTLSKTLPYAKGLVADLFPLSAISGEKEVVLTEGEADAVLLNQMGFATVSGTLGAGNWQRRNTDSLAGVQSLTILYDNDTAGKNGAQKRAAELSTVIPKVKIATYPDGVKDISEWVVRGGATDIDVRQILEAAVAFTPDQPNNVVEMPVVVVKNTKAQHNITPALTRKSISERIILARNVGPPPAELPYLFGPYLNLGATHWITGQTGIGKSTFVYNLAGAMAGGEEIWGLPCRKQRVLYHDMESGDIGRRLKMHRLYREREVPDDWLFATELIRFPDELADFLEYIKAVGVTFVILDTARRCFSVRDENDNAEVYRNIVPTLDALKQIGVGSLVLGHPPKNGGFGARGAGAQEDAGDVNLTLRMHQGEVTDPKGIVALTITKNRLLGLGHPPLLLKRVGNDRFERVGADEVGPADDQKDSAEPKAGERCRADMIAYLDDTPRARAIYRHIIDEMKAKAHSESTAKRVLNKLVSDKELFRADKDRHPEGLYCRPDPFADDPNPLTEEFDPFPDE